MKPNVIAFAVSVGIAAVMVGPTYAAGFGNAYYFGDSLTDCCYFGRTTNGGASNWSDQLPPLIGASYFASKESNSAVGGAQSGNLNANASFDAALGFQSGYLQQVANFLNQGKRFSSRDIVGIWIGTNDIWPSAIEFSIAQQRLGVQPAVNDLANYIAGNINNGINQLISAGAKNIILVSPYDLGVSDLYRYMGSSGDQSVQQLASDYSNALRNHLATLYHTNTNIYFIDTLALLRNVQANPGKYGFDHFLATDSCWINNCTSNLSLEQQNRYVFSDMIHLSSGLDNVMAKYIANIINARDSLHVLGGLSTGNGKNFSNSLLEKSDQFKKDSKGSETLLDDGALTVFVDGGYSRQNQRLIETNVGPDNAAYRSDSGDMTLGVIYQSKSNVRVGGAFRYSSNKTQAIGLSRTEIDSDGYQGGIFASYSPGGFFVSGAVSIGNDSFELNRPGVVDSLSSSIKGRTFTAATKAGYMYERSLGRIGPVFEISYTNTTIDGYHENGDSVLTMGVAKQKIESLTGGLGVQMDSILSLNSVALKPYAGVMALHDFNDSERFITSYQMSAPELLIKTNSGRNADSLYGRASVGFSATFSNNLSVTASTQSTFARNAGNNYLMNIGLNYKF